MEHFDMPDREHIFSTKFVCPLRPLDVDRSLRFQFYLRIVVFISRQKRYKKEEEINERMRWQQ